jgi:FtsP/CotA-like multicopper oxidase with cupredoxin domain
MKTKLLGAVAGVLLAVTGMPAIARLSSPTVANAAQAADPSKNPHYFGPYPNWVNSPQAMSDAVVTISGGGGAGAEAVATVEPTTGAITKIDVTVPGSGYTGNPNVTITAPVIAPRTVATATAQISTGAISSITVDETGYGFKAPVATLTPQPGHLPTTPATVVASGGVDDMAIVSGGVGYTNPTVEFTLPDRPGGTQATGTATQTGGVITGVAVVDPGSGYITAPGVTIKEGTTINPDAAVVTSTINVTQVDVDAGGAGYTGKPTISIMDVVDPVHPTNPPIDRNASGTVTISSLGAVTSITMGNHGAGYLTPGLRKFVDTLPGMGQAGENNLHTYIPTAVADTETYPGTDYYEIAVVQFRHQFSQDIPATLVRGYVQLSTSVVPGDNRTQLFNEMLTGAPVPVLLNGQPVYATDAPQYLGPTIIASKNRPVRVLFRNLLPAGSAGDLFIPVDTTVMGSGMGPDATTLDPTTKVPLENVVDQGTVTDGVRNPMCGNSPKPATCYTENRAELHLHGGITPWISDGTPHQWITPANETGTLYPKGVSVQNVPDMPDPGPGAETFFYTNQQSARLMFYHDHSWGITRLNVYAGEAAGYIITDDVEQSLFGSSGLFPDLGEGTPLIVQDKTFVASDARMAQLDPTWDKASWGGIGSLWVPHVYMPAQNPSAPSGQNPFGRWMYGSWFWPPATNVKYAPILNPYYDPTCDPSTAAFCEPQMIPGTPNISVGMEAFNDTPLVNGTAYPTTTLDPKTYRFRVLNAANDRFFNLQWYVADPTTGTLSEVALKQSEVDAAQTDPVVQPTVDTAKSPVGPSWVQIGTEGGFLPMPVIVPNQQVTYITDPTRFDVGNVDKHSLMLAPAERADVIVDFSQYRGKTLILYNDAPAAYPARQPNMDYYTGDPNLTASGGAPTTLPGYGPNTRTIMQVKVSTKAPAVAFDRPNTTLDGMGRLTAAFTHHLDGNNQPAGVFEKSQHPIIVGQAAYNVALGTSFIQTGWCSAPKNPTPDCDGFARIQEQGGTPFKFDTLNNTKLSIPFEPKGMHDEMNSASFDEYGRMSANMGLEAPGATPILQNIVLYPFVNPATEILDANALPSSLNVTKISSASDGTQIWKITHNGVDTHPIHFHLFDVQLINRVTWDGIIIPPEPTELGWKETVRVSPLEDTIVAVRPIVPTLPFNLPDSRRPLNPAMPIGATGDLNGTLNGQEAGFNNTDPLGQPMTTAISNDVVNFGWEYVFHCHILSHEEMDMMRPMIVHFSSTKPAAPTNVAAARTVDKLAATVTWTDPTPIDMTNLTTWGSRQNEIGFKVERATLGAGNVPAAYAQIGTSLANETEYFDATADRYTSYAYRISAWNEAGSTSSVVVNSFGQPMAPTALTARVQPRVGNVALAQVALSWTNNNLAYQPGDTIDVERAVGAGAYTNLAHLATTATSYVDATVDPGAYHYQVFVNRAGNSSGYAGPVDVSVGNTNMVLTNTPNPGVLGSIITFSVAVTSGGVSPNPAVPTGTVQFSVNGSNVNVPLDGAGNASYNTSSLSVGTYTITATYQGDAIFPSATATATQTVTLRPTTVVVASSRNPSTPAASVTLTATVAPVTGAGTPAGVVQFTITNGASPNTVTSANLVNGVASYTTSSLSTMAHTVTATYNGSSSFQGSTSSAFTQTVSKVSSTLTLSSATNPAVWGQTGGVKATLNTTLATGNVIFTVDGTAQAGIALVSGVATLNYSSLSVGTHSISASYAGDSSYNASSSASNLSQVINKASTTVSLSSSKNPAARGTVLTFTATVRVTAPGGGTAVGTVQFKVGTTNLGAAVTVNGAGVATVTSSTLAVGANSITAVYSGNTNYNTSTSTALNQTIQ